LWDRENVFELRDPTYKAVELMVQGNVGDVRGQLLVKDEAASVGDEVGPCLLGLGRRSLTEGEVVDPVDLFGSCGHCVVDLSESYLFGHGNTSEHNLLGSPYLTTVPSATLRFAEKTLVPIRYPATTETAMASTMPSAPRV